MNHISPKARATALLAALMFVVAGCGGSGGGGGAPPPNGGANHAPTISGTPATTAKVGTAYSFQPAAADTDGQALTFSISNKPTWAAFDSATGRLSGTPAAGDAGTFSSVVISVSDGAASASLSAFTITVQAGAVVGSASLNWTAPTKNEDGTPLTNLAGYKVRYGTNVGALNQLQDIPNPGTTSLTIQGLAAGTWYFTLASYTNVGVESAQTAAVSKTIG